MEAESTRPKRTSASARSRSKGSDSCKTARPAVRRSTLDASAEASLDDADQEAGPDFDDSEEARFEDAKANTARKLDKSLDATQLYLNEIGYSPLLTAEEEKHYARLARQGDE